MMQSRTVYHYQSRRDDRAVTQRIREIAETRIRYGVQRIHILLRREGWLINHKKTHRIYCQEGLNLRTKRPRRHVTARHRQERPAVTAADQCWSMDFVADNLFNGRRIRALTVVDNFSRECLAIEIDLNIPAQRVVRVLDRIVATRGYPVKMRMDNGPELISLTLAHWAEKHGVILEFIKPGKPTQNAFIERFNRTYRTEILDFYLFRTLNEVREITERWLREYNRERPHESLNNLTPEEYRLLAENNEISKSVWN